MPGRRPHLKTAAVPLAILTAAVFGTPAHGHRLEADFRVISGNRVQIESWFDLTGESPRGAKVRVLRADGSLLSEGDLDEKGTFVFYFPKAEPLKVLVSAPGGHAKELSIPKVALEGAADVAATPEPFADRSPRVNHTELLSGIAAVLALAAFVLSVRNARRLRRVEGNVQSIRNDKNGPE